MDHSKALLRCLEQLTITSRGCLRSRSSPASRNQRIRTFCVSLHHQQPSPETPQSAEERTMGTLAKATAKIDSKFAPSRSTLRESQSQSPSQPRTDNIPAPRSNFRMGSAPRVRNAPIDTSIIEGIDKMIRGKASTESSPARYNNNTYGRDGEADKRVRQPARLMNRPSNLNVAELVGQRLAEDPAGMADLIPEEKKLRLKPTLGRSVNVDLDRNMDLTRAFVSLEQRINGRGNSVRRDERAQRFHVRRGQLKKIKRRLNWGRLFKAGFIAECARVRKMVKQGW